MAFGRGDRGGRLRLRWSSGKSRQNPPNPDAIQAAVQDQLRERIDDVVDLRESAIAQFNSGDAPNELIEFSKPAIG
jgi:hypothetical protein